MNRLPKAKTEDIVVQDLRDELLVYNLTTHQAFTLNETLKIVYQSCDGQTSFDDLKRKYQFTNDLVHLALAELKANDLLIDYTNDHFTGLSRREAIKKVGLASMIALPLIASIVAPSAVHAASGSTCSDQPSGVDPSNGAEPRGRPCLCNIAAIGFFQPCNTTRGGFPDLLNGCQPGCLCRYSGTAAQCGNGNGANCGGTCG